MTSKESERRPRHFIYLFISIIAGVALFTSCVSTPATGDSGGKAAAVASTSPSQESSSIWRDDATSAELVYLPLGIHFPRNTDHLVLGKKTVYDGKGRDVSVGYNSPDLPLWLTFYVYLKSYYPHKDTLSHFQAVLGDVMAGWPESELKSTESADFSFGHTRVHGMIALVHYGKGPTPGEWGGYALLFPYGDYYVYLRTSFLGFDNETAVQATRILMERFLGGLGLPAPVNAT